MTIQPTFTFAMPPKPVTFALSRVLWIALILATLLSCTIFHPEPSVEKPVALPETFSLYESGPAPLSRWWESLGAADLNNLIERALTDNFSIRQTWARLAQIRAAAVQAGAARYPDLTASAGASLGRRGTADGNSQDSATVRDYSLGVISQYEIDLWGRIRSQKEAALISADAGREDVSTAAMSIAAEMAVRWVDLLARRLEKKLLQEQLQLNRTILELVELRFRNGMVSALDVFQQKQVIADTEGQVPLVIKQEQLLLNQLAVLSGQAPGADLGIVDGALPEIDAPPDTGLPVDVLARRPDVRAAGLRLKAAEWQVAEARANRLPALRLTARGQYGDDSIEQLFDNWLLNLAANLTAPLLDGGYRRAEVQRRQAVVQERIGVYGQTVLVAVREVEDALVAETQQRRHLHWLKKEVAAAQRALKEAGFRYRQGLNDYLPVLTQLLAVQRLERDLIHQEALLLQARIDLYRALGGNWTDQLAIHESLTPSMTTDP